MIKGKFYTGLPDKMMNRSRGMDRQQTNFFWPDESEAEETPSRQRSVAKKMTSAMVNNEQQVDIKPKELFKKQLSSGIQFYDNVDAKTPEARRRRFKKIDNINLNNVNVDRQYAPEKKKLETFSSKIEFYDFVDDNKPKGVKTNNNVKSIPIKINRDTDFVKKSVDSNSSDTMKKRITFQPETTVPEKTKSILKNVEKLDKPLPKRGLLPKSLSKSVENIPKLRKSAEELDKANATDRSSETLSSIIREVRNMNLSNSKSSSPARNGRYVDDYDDDDDYQPRRSNIREPYRRSERDNKRETGDERSYSRRDDDVRRYNRYDDNDFVDRQSNRNYDDDRRYNRPHVQRPRNDRHEYHYEGRSTSNRTRKSPDRRDADYYEDRRPVKKQYDDYEFADKSSTKVPEYDRSKDKERKSINYESNRIENNGDRNDNYTRTNRNSSPNNRSDRREEVIGSRSTPVTDSVTNGRSHRHLQSNIFFNDEQANRPISVRNSAVTRIGVGLPDI